MTSRAGVTDLLIVMICSLFSFFLPTRKRNFFWAPVGEIIELVIS